jgi:hypothetical protein
MLFLNQRLKCLSLVARRIHTAFSPGAQGRLLQGSLRYVTMEV